MSNITFRDRYNYILNSARHIRTRSNRGEAINPGELQNLINTINAQLDELPVGTPQEGLPENAYNQLVNLRDIIQGRLNSYRATQMSAGRKKKNTKKISKRKGHKKRRQTRHKRH